jgi:hypothetical protein
MKSYEKRLPTHNKLVGVNGSLNLSKTVLFQHFRFAHNGMAERDSRLTEPTFRLSCWNASFHAIPARK